MKNASLMTALAGFLALSSVSVSWAQQSLADRFYDEAPGVKAEIEACAATSTECAVLKGEGLAYGMAGWPEDPAQAILVLKGAASQGSLEAMALLGDLYDEQGETETAIAWYGQAALSAVDDADRDVYSSDFLSFGYELGQTFADWRSITLAKPMRRVALPLGGYMGNMKRPDLSEVQAIALNRAQQNHGVRQLTEADIWTIMQLASRNDPVAMDLYGQLLIDGYGLRKNPELGRDYIDAAKTWVER